ncbi:MAG: hypothetical protein EOQ55_00700 [Mesorhizobium sp.]|uniref:hypothetical protein n=1 Tax=Mesorhizobium sp. TaxID=1871066 RepID=UPI000FE8C4D7|nr:hypothetical protein [Mesorhizobium sp.]RWG23309.1 MAG: hypothetical protein EOQ55_00700 [Mesorhizobium sp.]RWG60493.1 MAG: hypothetical protein EOQ64_01575 [Mesorhizobium sp.]RWH39492.1 MAG: hypothetical protein EOQ78_22170 [Mesorhizobium sp.]
MFGDSGQFYPFQPLQFMDGLLTPNIGLNQYVTFFSEYTVGAQPSDWTSRYGTGFTATVQNGVSGSLSGYVLRWTKTAAARQALSWDRVPNAADVEVLMRLRAIEAYAVNENFLGAYVRGGGSSGSETGWRGEIGGLTTGTLANTNTVKYVSGTATTLGTTTGIPSPNYAVNDWLWLRFRVNGSSEQSKTWHHGVAEPGAWDQTFSDAAVAGAGWTGIQQVSANPNAECDFFSVALNGETALGP